MQRIYRRIIIFLQIMKKQNYILYILNIIMCFNTMHINALSIIFLRIVCAYCRSGLIILFINKVLLKIQIISLEF